MAGVFYAGLTQHPKKSYCLTGNLTIEFMMPSLKLMAQCKTAVNPTALEIELLQSYTKPSKCELP